LRQPPDFTVGNFKEAVAAVLHDAGL
jgi:hypothetical protein